MFESVVKEYQKLEPPGRVSWSPLKIESEFWHRFRIYQSLRSCLLGVGREVSEMRFLDVGCGTGMSTRLLVELCARPEFITGVDLRDHALESARGLSPTISYVTIRTPKDLEVLQGFDFCMQCVVFSSIQDRAERLWLAQRMIASVKSDGHIFWWDKIKSLSFAGRDCLDPCDYFSSCKLLYRADVSTRPTIAECVHLPSRLLKKSFCGGKTREFPKKFEGHFSNTPLFQKPARWLTPIFAALQRALGHPKTHRVALFRVS